MRCNIARENRRENRPFNDRRGRGGRGRGFRGGRGNRRDFVNNRRNDVEEFNPDDTPKGKYFLVTISILS